MTGSEGSGQPRSTPLPTGILLFNYRIVKKLASRGFSFIYLTADEHGTPVAVKECLSSSLARRVPGELVPVMPEESASAFHLGLKYFFEEGRSLAKVSHPAIVRVLSFFRENGTVYTMMTYEQGEALQEHILTARQQDKLKILRGRFIRQVFHDLTSGLCEVHVHKLPHLGIEPDNTYLREDSSPILPDLDAAQQTLTAEVSRFQPMYAPGFATSELYRRRNELGPWTDIYSISATIYTYMAGTLPREATQREKGGKLEEGLEHLRKVYTAGLIDLAGWCLKMKPGERPQSVLRLQKVLCEGSNALTELQALAAITQDGPVPGEKGVLTTRFMNRLLYRQDS